MDSAEGARGREVEAVARGIIVHVKRAHAVDGSVA